jgi:hypothetical protein
MRKIKEVLPGKERHSARWLAQRRMIYGHYFRRLEPSQSASVA